MNQDLVLEMMDACEKRRRDRRAMLRMAGSAGLVVAGSSLLAACGDDDEGPVMTPTPAPTPSPTPTPTPTPTTAEIDLNVLNFALNLEYLEANFYAYAATGAGLSADMQTGTGDQGAVTGGRKVAFTDPVVMRYANEISNDETAHVAFLRQALGSAAVAQPAIDISASGPFSAAARAAGLIGAGQTFDPYASDENFLLAAFIFEDVGVTAYKGASPLLENKTFLEAAAGILAAEAYHAGLIRTTLYRKGLTTPSLIDATEKISDARDTLDGDGDSDQGIAPIGTMSNIVPADANGVAFSRSPEQVLDIVYLDPAATPGGFFPAGVNGTLPGA